MVRGMPVDTDDPVWTGRETEPSTREGLREFLRTNAGTAFSERELADAVLGTDWAAVHERRRLVEELGRGTFRERLDAGEYPELEGIDSLSATIDRRLDTNFLAGHLSALVDEGSVAAKLVPVAEADEPGDDGAVPHYTWVG